MGDVPDTDSNEPNSVISLLRWINVLPGGLVSGWGAYVAIYWLNRFTFSFSSMNPDSFFNRLFIEGVSQGALGAVAVYVGVKIAPAHRLETAIVIGILLTLVTGFLLFPAVTDRQWWVVYGSFAMLVGTVGMCWSIYAKQVEV